MHRFEVDKEQLSKTRLSKLAEDSLPDGTVRVAVERFALTANNVTYGVVGERIGYWRFYPADENWGVVPVWGFGKIVDSRCAGVDVGERLYGFFPTASHCDLMPAKLANDRLIDGTQHRRELPAVYNSYARTRAETWYDSSMDDERMLLMPLYVTSYCLCDFLLDNAYFDAEQLIVSSASSKTAIGLAYALAREGRAPPSIGLTSAGNRQAVEALGLYGSVTDYDSIETIDASVPTAIVDMSGNGAVLSHLHRHLGANMRYTSNVGVTHYDANEMGEHYAAERSAMFFAPGHIKKRADEWGSGVLEQKATQFWADAARRSREWLTIERVRGLDALPPVFEKLLAGGIPPTSGLVIEI